MKKKNIVFLIVLLISLISLPINNVKAEDEWKLLCHYTYKGADENNERDDKTIESQIKIIQNMNNEEKIAFQFFYDSNSQDDSLQQKFETSKLKNTNTSLNNYIEVYLDNDAINKIRNGQCPSFSSYIRKLTNFTSLYTPKICLSEDEEYCKNLDNKYINMQKAKNTKSIACNYQIKDKNNKVCNIKINLDEYKNGYILYKGENDNDYKNAITSIINCNNNQTLYFNVKDKYDDSIFTNMNDIKQNFLDKTENLTVCPEYNVYEDSAPSFHYKVVFDAKKQNTDNNANNDDKTEEIKNQFLGNITCGGIKYFKFPATVPKLTSLVYNLLKIAVPVILVIMGMMDMIKAASAQKEDEMKKAQKKFIQRLIAGICALLVFIIVETVINFIAEKTGNNNAMDCVNCFINGIDYCTDTKK